MRWLSVFALTACTSISTSNPESLNELIFKSTDDAITINIATSEIIIRGDKFNLTDCSTEKIVCLRSETASFSLQVPKICPNSIIDIDDYPYMKLISVIPHLNGGGFLSTEETFIYEYSLEYGLTAMYYANNKNIGTVVMENDLSLSDIQNYKYDSKENDYFLCEKQ